MNKIIVDQSLQATLSALNEPVEICDSAGNILGQFWPNIPVDPADLEPRISEEELDRRERTSTRRYTTEEVLRHLESL
jgi:hypothetical protein